MWTLGALIAALILGVTGEKSPVKAWQRAVRGAVGGCVECLSHGGGVDVRPHRACDCVMVAGVRFCAAAFVGDGMWLLQRGAGSRCKDVVHTRNEVANTRQAPEAAVCVKVGGPRTLRRATPLRSVVSSRCPRASAEAQVPGMSEMLWGWARPGEAWEACAPREPTRARVRVCSSVPVVCVRARWLVCRTLLLSGLSTRA